MPGGTGKPLDDDLGRGARDPGALARAHLDHPHLLEMEQRLADGRPADAEADHKFALGGKLVPRKEVRVADHLLQTVGHILVQLAPFDRRKAHLVYLSYHAKPKATAAGAWESMLTTPQKGRLYHGQARIGVSGAEERGDEPC